MCHVKVRIEDVWSAFAKGKSILRSPKSKINFKIRLFKAACKYYRTLILTKDLIEKRDIFMRICYRIILGIKHSRDIVTNESLYHLKFTGNCIHMPTDKSAKHFVIYESKIRSYLRHCTRRTTYRNQISSHILPGEKTLEASEIRKMALKKSERNKHFDVSKK